MEDLEGGDLQRHETHRTTHETRLWDSVFIIAIVTLGGFSTYLHLVWGSRGFLALPPGGRRLISPVVPLELREGQVL